MSSNKLKRFPIKYIRDKAKSAYVKDIKCYVCEASENLELHHVCSISELFNRWCQTNKITIDDLPDILEHREQFIAEHHKELYDEVRTLCKICHLRLHKLFGQHPALHTAEKQLRWLDNLRVKIKEKADNNGRRKKYF